MKKGIAFSLDAGFAGFILLGIVLMAHFYISGTDRFALGKLQMERNFEDSLAVMDNLERLSEGDIGEINNTLFNLTQKKYMFNLILSEYSLEGGFLLVNETFVNNSEVPKKYVYANNYFFVDEDVEEFYDLRYLVWKK